MRIGILGGTFNPIHNGHIKIAETAKKKCSLESVILLPTGNPPHKKNKITDKSHRYKMVSEAIKNKPGLSVSDLELKRDGYVYTVDTLKTLNHGDGSPGSQDGPGEPSLWFYIIGADVLFDLENWKNFSEVSKLCNFIVFRRPGSCESFNDRVRYMKEKYGDIFNIIGFDIIDISSTYIRKNIMKTDIIENILPEGVYEYIKENKLYGYE
jgi:nicotinate-nucleotide adenylyltransferase